MQIQVSDQKEYFPLMFMYMTMLTAKLKSRKFESAKKVYVFISTIFRDGTRCFQKVCFFCTTFNTRSEIIFQNAHA